ncbi:hypothetical protein [Limnohabitans sp. Rim28]|uniref:hypothetical protein n=1 Tax=Limnohabitans sp. Rim28 TaxID=1100720 RepID=UPI00036ACE11|nr:hypothetical protein [Limnohabitans sp. Rim28]PVE08877.1 hypothetical protein B472_03875 [Limnohabitans sp. Rim28]
MNFSIWAVSVGLVAELLGVAIALATIALGHATCLEGELKVVAACVLFGGLGGVTYCLRGVYLNACVRKQWDVAWLPWYLLRPIVSLVLGGVSYLFVKSGLLLLGATQDQTGSQLGIWAISYIAGLNVDRFLAKIEDIGLTVWGIEPSRQSKPEAKQTVSFQTKE